MGSRGCSRFLILFLCLELGASLSAAPQSSGSMRLATDAHGDGPRDDSAHAPAFVALVSRAVVGMRAIRHRYEAAWLTAIVLLLGVTAAYAAAVKGKKSPAEGAEKSEGALVAMDKTSGHRQPLDQVVTGEGDSSPGGAGPPAMMQCGYVNSQIGQILFYTWVLVPALGYLQLALFTADQYLFELHSPDQTWIQLAEPFLLVFAISHIFFFLQCFSLGKARVFFMNPAGLDVAEKVLVEGSDPADSILLDVKAAGDEDSRYFEYTCVRYVWSASDGRFLPKGVETGLTPSGAAARIKAGGLSAAGLRDRSLVGENVIHVEVPGVLGSLAIEFLSPIYCFQFSCIWMYMFYTTWNIATIWLVLVMFSGVTKSLLIIRTNKLKIQELARTEVEVKIQRQGVWSEVRSGEVLPGDVLLIDEGVVSCDVLVVEGCAVVNESMLTGEPMPVQRFQVDSTLQGDLDTEKHKKHCILAGTKVIQSAGPSDGKALGIALATGARTAKGALVRMVLFPSPILFRFTDQMLSMYALMFLYVCILFCVCMIKDQGHWIIAVFTGLCILAQSLNPNMPVSLAFGQSIAATRMDKHCQVKCLAPERIPIAGKVHVMVMDKTGTITKDGMDFEGVRPTSDGGKSFTPLQSVHANGGSIDVSKLPEAVGWALAACHTVTKLRDGTLVGNMVECAMLQAAGQADGWALSDDSKSVANGKDTIRIMRQLEFDHHRMTSGAVIEIRGKSYVLIKGSYEAVEAEVAKGGLPKDFKNVTETYAKEQYYVLGLGLRELAPGWEEQDRNSLESGLAFLGLLLFRNEMKPDSADAVQQLKEGGVRNLMCTGDNALTGAAIARTCGMIAEGTRVILGEKDAATGGLAWSLLPDGGAVPHAEVMQSSMEDTELVVTKGAFKELLRTGEIQALLKHIRVYARMKPDDKVKVIQLHQEEGWTVGMVGDGGNDCGALRSAHVGIALSEAEASIVAPFSSGAEYGTGSKSLMAVVHLLRYGRATLATNLATYNYFMVYGLTLPPCKLVVVFMGNMMLAEWHWLFIDIMLSAVLVGCMTLSEPSEKLAAIRPTCSLFGARTVSSVLMHCFVFFLFFGFSMTLLREQSFYISYDAVSLGIPAHEWAKKSDNYECAVTFLVLALQLATAGYAYTLGAEHRQSVFRNYSLTAVYVLVLGVLFALVLGGPSEFHCVFRVNCDQKTSREMYVPFIQEMSTGNTGGCFLGPQLQEWQHEFGSAYSLPDEDKNGCRPTDTFDPEKSVQVDSGAFFLGALQCLGSNNCFSQSFRTAMAGLMAAQVAVSLVAQKLMLMSHPGQREHFKKL